MNKKEFDEKLKAIPFPYGKSEWSERRRSIRKHAEQDGVENFLQWSTIQATMFVGNNPETDNKYNALSPFYKKYIYEEGVGEPTYYSDGVSSGNYINQAYVLENFIKNSENYIHNPKTIAEFGGGFGAMRVLWNRIWSDTNYYMFDFPEFLLLQEYYISNTITAETQYRSTNSKANVDLIIAMASLSEAPVAQRELFLKNVKADAYFILFQPEFYGVDNLKYFKDWADKNLSDYRIWPSEFNIHNYLAGRR